MARKINHATLMDFVQKLRQATGGYSATPLLPATIEDTFHAVAIQPRTDQTPVHTAIRARIGRISCP